MFGTKVLFGEAFPQIKTIRIEVGEVGYGTSHYMSELTIRVYTDGEPGEYVDCSNPRCHNGGVLLGSIIREMVRERLTEKEVSTICRGNEGSSQQVTRKCLNQFTIKVVLEFKMRRLSSAYLCISETPQVADHAE